jgi:hypothetical protein
VNLASRPSAQSFDNIDRKCGFSEGVSKSMSHSVCNAAVSIDSKTLDESNQLF